MCSSILSSEAILTRNKAMLLKRQLRNTRNTDERIKYVLQGSQTKSPTSKQKTVIRSPKKPKVHNLKLHQIKCGKSSEFYPDKFKRTVRVKKVRLKPKHEMKFVGSKRKLQLPQKSGTESPLQQARDEVRAELSVQDLIQLTEEQELSEEDFLEILTCESPVWWEDPPNEFYNEESIFKRSNRNYTSQPSQTNILAKDEIKIPESKETDVKFMTKRSKLENLLGDSNVTSTSQQDLALQGDTIYETKWELNTTEDNELQRSESSISTEEDLFLDFQNDEIQQSLHHIPVQKYEITDKVILSDDDQDSKNTDLQTKHQEDAKRNEITNQVIMLHDSQDSQKSELDSLTQEQRDTKHNDMADKDSKNVELVHLITPENRGLYVFKYEPLCNNSKNNSEQSLSTVVSGETKKSSTYTVTKNSKDLIQDLINVPSATFLEGKIKDSEIRSEKKKNSDRKIKDQTEVISDSVNIACSKIRKSKDKNVNKDELMIVYKIITDDDYNDYKPNQNMIMTNVEGKDAGDNLLDSFNKKCKDTYINCEEMKPQSVDKLKINDLSSKTSKSSEDIISSDTDVLEINSSESNRATYCYKCSSIFDTEFCPYCIKKCRSNLSSTDHCESCCKE